MRQPCDKHARNRVGRVPAESERFIEIAGFNQASISVGWGNSGTSLPLSDWNVARIDQQSESNEANIAIDGSRNLANVVQLGGAGNAFDLDITGNDNNRGSAFTSGSDAALA